MMHRSRALAALAAAGVLSACEPATAPEDPYAHLPAGIHPVLVADQDGTGGTVELHLRRVEVADLVAGVQGEIHFDAERLALQGASFAEGAAGMWNPTAPGRIRFAGVDTDGFADAAVLTLRFRGDVRGAARTFVVRLEEVTAVEGLADRTTLVVPAERPILLLD